MSEKPQPTFGRYILFLLALPYWIFRAASRIYWEEQFRQVERRSELSNLRHDAL
jgi:hypothetical protein